MRCPVDSCSGIVVVTDTARDGARASCRRCHCIVSTSTLLDLIDEQAEALERAERKVERLYAMGKDRVVTSNRWMDLFSDAVDLLSAPEVLAAFGVDDDAAKGRA